jgi:stage II sporulation protein D
MIRATALLCGALLLVWPGASTPGRATEPLIVRIGIQVDRPSVVLAADGPVEAVQPDTGDVATLPGTQWAVAATAAGLSVGGAECGAVVRVAARSGIVRVDGRSYRGTIEVRRTSAGRVTAIDELPLEQYLYGVIKGEIDPHWPSEAVKAQAIAARTLAVERIEEAHAALTGYDLPPQPPRWTLRGGCS